MEEGCPTTLERDQVRPTIPNVTLNDTKISQNRRRGKKKIEYQNVTGTAPKAHNDDDGTTPKQMTMAKTSTRVHHDEERHP